MLATPAEKEIKPLSAGSPRSEQNLSLWTQVEKFEGIIDHYNLRELARIPFVLKVIVTVLAGIEEEDQQASIQREDLSRYYLIERYYNKVGCDDDQNKKIDQGLRSLALELSGYRVNPTKKCYIGSNDQISLLLLTNLIEWDNQNSRYKFCNPMIQELLIAKEIEEELTQLDAITLTTSNEKAPNKYKEILLNQYPLRSGMNDNLIIQALAETVRDERISKDLLLNLINLSRQKQGESNSPTSEEEFKQYSAKENEQQPPLAKKQVQSHFGIAAANAITILNAAGFDFTNHDLSNVYIAGANLSHGIFESTNFQNANLQGVNFTDAWLKDAIFDKALMYDVEFSETPNLKLNNESLNGVAYAAEPHHLAVETPEETLILENANGHKGCFKEIMRVPGAFSALTRSPFSTDNKQILTLFQNQLCFWEITTGEILKKVNIEDKGVLCVSSDLKEVVMSNGNDSIEKYSIERDSWMDLPTTIRNKNNITSYDFGPSGLDLLLARGKLKGAFLCNSITGRLLWRQREALGFCVLSSDGKQVASGVNKEFIYISDSVRGGLTIKVLGDQINDDSSGQSPIFSFHPNDKLALLSTNKAIEVLDISNGLSIKQVAQSRIDQKRYSLHPDGQFIALIDDKNTICFESIYHDNSEFQPRRDTDRKGLNLQGATANRCGELSEKNIMLFVDKGEYYPFDKSIIQGIFSKKPEDANSTEEVNLAAADLNSTHARIIANCVHWCNLRKLNLWSNQLEDDGGELIGNSKSWMNLEELILRQSEIGDKTAVAIGKNQSWKSLKKLDLASNEICDAGADAIGANERWINLEELNLSHNRIREQWRNFNREK